MLAANVHGCVSLPYAHFKMQQQPQIRMLHLSKMSGLSAVKQFWICSAGKLNHTESNKNYAKTVIQRAGKDTEAVTLHNGSLLTWLSLMALATLLSAIPYFWVPDLRSQLGPRHLGKCKPWTTKVILLLYLAMYTQIYSELAAQCNYTKEKLGLSVTWHY